MARRTFSSFALAVVLVVWAASAQAQTERKFEVHVGGGVSPTTGDISRRLTTGWHGTIGAGYNFNQRFSTLVEFTVHSLGVEQSVLQAVQIPGGSAHLYSLTLDPMLKLATSGRVMPYIIGGGGFYRRTVEFTQPAVSAVPLFDPFFGFFVGTGLVPTSQVVASSTSNAGGLNVGGGFIFPIKGLNLYTEARYHWAATHRVETQVVPVTIGLRF